MTTKKTKDGITYEKEVIFRRLAELYFSMMDIDSSFMADDEEGLVLGENDEIEFAEPLEDEEDTEEELSPILTFDDAYQNFQDGLFDQFAWLFEGLAIPFYESSDLSKEFENFTKKEYGISIVLKLPKKKPQLTVVPNDQTKK